MPKRQPTASRRPRPTDAAQLIALAEELSSLGLDQGLGGPHLGIFRILAGLDAAGWSRLAKRLKLTGWLALPLEGPDARNARETLLAALGRLSSPAAVPEPLTLLPGQGDLERVLALELERSRHQDASVSLAALEVEDLSGIDRAHGPDFAEEVLAALAEELLRVARSFDLAARLGRERFALVLPGLGLFRARAAILRVQAEFQGRRFGGRPFAAFCCVGLACSKGACRLPTGGLLGLAAKALAEAKSQGPGTVKLAEPAHAPYVAQTLVHASEKKFLFTRKLG